MDADPAGSLRTAQLMRALLPLLASLATTALPAPDNQVVLELVPTPEVPRNSEGAFVTRRDGAIDLYYTQFQGGDLDHSAARLAAIRSLDGGRSWGPPRVVLENPHGGGLNVMSVSVLPLGGTRLALFYLFTRSTEDCRPYLCYSEDDGATWSTPRLLIPHPGYYILNNDRVVQTSSGRLILPMNLHRKAGMRGTAVWYFSDDAGATWTESDSRWGVAEGKSGLQESGVVETAPDCLLSWFRTDLGSQYECRSFDDGLTWTAPVAGPLRSPLSAASIKRLPGSRDLIALFNDHSGSFPFVAEMRTPLVLARSSDGGKTWPARRAVEPDTSSWYHYIAMHFAGDALLLAYNAGNDRMAKLSSPLRIRRIDRKWLPEVPSAP
jgi:sialidase-1